MTAHQPDNPRRVSDTIGLIAGAGSVPKEVAEAIVASGHSVHVIALRNIADADFAQIPHTVVGLGQLGRMLRTLRVHGCGKLIMSGGLERPDLLSLLPDLGFFLNLGTILGLMRGGDDTILRKILGFFERKGFEPVGVADVAPALLASDGVMAGQINNAAIDHSTKLAFRIVDRLAQFDIGQAVVVRDGQVIGIEAAEGTDGLPGQGRPCGHRADDHR